MHPSDITNGTSGKWVDASGLKSLSSVSSGSGGSGNISNMQNFLVSAVIDLSNSAQQLFVKNSKLAYIGTLSGRYVCYSVQYKSSQSASQNYYTNDVIVLDKNTGNGYKYSETGRYYGVAFAITNNAICFYHADYGASKITYIYPNSSGNITHKEVSDSTFSSDVIGTNDSMSIKGMGSGKYAYFAIKSAYDDKNAVLGRFDSSAKGTGNIIFNYGVTGNTIKSHIFLIKDVSTEDVYSLYVDNNRNVTVLSKTNSSGSTTAISNVSLKNCRISNADVDSHIAICSSKIFYMTDTALVRTTISNPSLVTTVASITYPDTGDEYNYSHYRVYVNPESKKAVWLRYSTIYSGISDKSNVFGVNLSTGSLVYSIYGKNLPLSDSEYRVVVNYYILNGLNPYYREHILIAFDRLESAGSYKLITGVFNIDDGSITFYGDSYFSVFCKMSNGNIIYNNSTTYTSDLRECRFGIYKPNNYLEI